MGLPNYDAYYLAQFTQIPFRASADIEKREYWMMLYSLQKSSQFSKKLSLNVL